ncbi:MAG TPA: lysylphosphatidylglycerol synthase transmembrane domain-containing protein [Candidatus Dormibacteraeota bacterium]|nr:lysylphosphatidylglycerol synthase transmembrane domain-containing protein [Candidatus Dormibacteraeota bacterium]
MSSTSGRARRGGGSSTPARALRRLHRNPAARPVLGFLRRHWMVAVAVVSIVVLVLAVNPGKLWGVLSRVELRPLLLMLPCTLAVYVVRGFGWHAALRQIGVKISMHRSVVVMLAGQAMVFLPAGDLARVKMVRDTGASGHDAGEITGTIAFQELLYMTLMGFAVLPAIAQHPDIGGVVAIITLLQVSIFVVLLWERGYKLAVRTVERIRFLRCFDRELRDIRPAFVRLFEPRAGIPIVLCNMLAVTLAFVLFLLALRAVGVHNIGFAKAAFIYALGHILAALTFLPGGVGAYEGILTAFMALQGVPPSQGAAAALLYRGFNDILMAVIGLGSGWWLRHHWPHPGGARRRPRGAPSAASRS